MKTITITSQGQITIPAKVRKAWGIAGSAEVYANYNTETRQLIIEKPLTMEEFIAITEPITKKIPKNIKPIPADKIHEYYELHRSKEIMDTMRDSL